MNFAPENIFINIGPEKQEIFTAACESHIKITVKTLEPSSEITILEVIGFEHGKLICSGAQKLSAPVSGEFIVQIFIGSEKYYALMKFERKLDSFYLDTSGKLFHLQRREDFRLRIPSSFHAYAKIKLLNKSPIQRKVPLLDFSGGGCRLESAAGEFKINDEIDLELQFQSRSPFPVKGLVKHLAPHPDQLGTEWIGIQFSELSELIKNKIIAIKLDIYRELFSKLK